MELKEHLITIIIIILSLFLLQSDSLIKIIKKRTEAFFFCLSFLLEQNLAVQCIFFFRTVYSIVHISHCENRAKRESFCVDSHCSKVYSTITSISN